MQDIYFSQNKIINLPSINFPNRTFHINRLIGQGGEGQIYSATPTNWGINNKDVALKFCWKINEDEQQLIQLLILYQQNENNLHQDQKSQIIKIYEMTNYNDKSLIIMELGQQNLFDYMQSVKGQLNIQQKIKILQQLTQSILWLHNRNIIHRDIKPENYIKIENEFKLIDFGQTKNNQTLYKTKNVGSQLFQAPEIQNGSSNYNFKVDIWSLGGTFYEILNEDDFKGNSNGISIKSYSQSIPFSILSELQNLVNRMLQNESFKRDSAQAIITNLKQIENQLQFPQHSLISSNFQYRPFQTNQTQNVVPFQQNVRQQQLDQTQSFNFDLKIQSLTDKIEQRFVSLEQQMLEFQQNQKESQQAFQNQCFQQYKKKEEQLEDEKKSIEVIQVNQQQLIAQAQQYFNNQSQQNQQQQQSEVKNAIQQENFQPKNLTECSRIFEFQSQLSFEQVKNDQQQQQESQKKDYFNDLFTQIKVMIQEINQNVDQRFTKLESQIKPTRKQVLKEQNDLTIDDEKDNYIYIKKRKVSNSEQSPKKNYHKQQQKQQKQKEKIENKQESKYNQVDYLEEKMSNLKKKDDTIQDQQQNNQNNYKQKQKMNEI